MLGPREFGESLGQTVAQKSPRLGGALAILFAVVCFGLGSFLDEGVFLILSSLCLGGGTWIAITGRNWKIPDNKPPTWWKVGFMITAGACIAACYAYIFSDTDRWF